MQFSLPQLQSVTQNVNETSGFQQQTAQFRKKGRVRIGLVVNHTALAMALQYPSIGEFLKLTLETRGRHSHPAGKFGDVPNLLGLHERCRKNPLAGLRKQGIESAGISRNA